VRQAPRASRASPVRPARPVVQAQLALLVRRAARGRLERKGHREIPALRVPRASRVFQEQPAPLERRDRKV
jgi:hypothetical protein